MARLGDVLGRLVAARGTATVAAAVGMSEDALRDGLRSVGGLSFATVSSIIGALDLRFSAGVVYADPDDAPDLSTPMWTVRLGHGPFRPEIGQPAPPDDER